MACGACDNFSAKVRAKQKPEASPDGCAFLVIHQALALKYLNFQTEEGIKEGPPFRTLYLNVDIVSPNPPFLLRMMTVKY